MAELGWIGVAIPEEYGGFGGSFLDLTVLIEAMGEACLPMPFFNTVAIVGSALQLSAAEDLKQELLPKIAMGELIGSFALIEPGNTYGTTNIQSHAIGDDDGYRLTGRKIFVEYAEAADQLLTVANIPGKGLGLFLIDTGTSGIKMSAMPTLDDAKQCEVHFENVAIRSRQVLAIGDVADTLLQRLEEMSAVGKCSEMVGAIQPILDMSVSYVKDREQFGKPVGAFQAVQHHCANMAVDVDCCRYITKLAASKISAGEPAAKEAAMAKSYTSKAAVRVAKLGHQTHGAISFCDDHDMHLYLRRCHAASVAFGDAKYHLEKVAQEIGL
jgi:alkylation response protein AidB-like acyl-CoA dehydrogenase